jgi:hypothetical protein
MQERLIILFADRGIMEGQRYARLWAKSKEIVDKSDAVGEPPLKINCEYDIIDHLRNKLPGEFDCTVTMVQAAGQKGGLFVKSLTAVPLANITKELPFGDKKP